MSLFGAHTPGDVADAADKFISKMDESELASAMAAHQEKMALDGRRALVESILDAFRHRGESSEDVAEESGVGLEAIQNGDVRAVSVLLQYVRRNTGLLKEAATALIEQHPEVLAQLPRSVLEGISARLTAT